VASSKEIDMIENNQEFQNKKYFDKFLIATPKVVDFNFCCSVIYILNDGSNGTNPFGVILNGRRVSDVILLKQNKKLTNLDSFFSNLGSMLSNPNDKTGIFEVGGLNYKSALTEEIHPLYFSGPVKSGVHFFYNKNIFTPQDKCSIATNIFSGSYDDFINFAAKDLLKENNFQVSTGIVKWKNEFQLNFEIQNGAWKVVDFNENIFFNSKELNKLSGKPETRLSPSFN
jgi:putative AlgH/UPF0301 family transcriptional regulator